MLRLRAGQQRKPTAGQGAEPRCGWKQPRLPALNCDHEVWTGERSRVDGFYVEKLSRLMSMQDQESNVKNKVTVSSLF